MAIVRLADPESGILATTTCWHAEAERHHAQPSTAGWILTDESPPGGIPGDRDAVLCHATLLACLIGYDEASLRDVAADFKLLSPSDWEILVARWARQYVDDDSKYAWLPEGRFEDISAVGYKVTGVDTPDCLNPVVIVQLDGEGKAERVQASCASEDAQSPTIEELTSEEYREKFKQALLLML